MLNQSLIAAGTVGWIVVAAIAGGIERTDARSQTALENETFAPGAGVQPRDRTRASRGN